MSAAPLPLDPDEVDARQTLLDRIRLGIKQRARTAKFRRRISESAQLRLSRIEQKAYEISDDEDTKIQPIEKINGDA